MKTLDKSNRINIPKSIIDICNIDLNTNVILYLYTEYKPNALLLSNDTELKFPCFGEVNFDENKRFFLPKSIRSLFNITQKNEILIYSLNHQLIIEIL